MGTKEYNAGTKAKEVIDALSVRDRNYLDNESTRHINKSSHQHMQKRRSQHPRNNINNEVLIEIWMDGLVD